MLVQENGFSGILPVLPALVIEMKKLIGIIVSLAAIGGFAHNPVAAQVSHENDQRAVASAATDANAASKPLHRPRIGLALGGGGSRGSAHVGVLQVLKEEHIPIDLIAGTSIGSVVGGFYAAGVPLNEIGDVFENETFTKQFTPRPILRAVTVPITLTARMFGYHPYDGLFYGGKFRKYANKVSGNKKIEQLNFPFAAVVTDVVLGTSCRLTDGDLGLAMQASTAVPELKKPVQIGDKLYCDGGVINNVPVSHVREMGADFVIAVDIDEQLNEVPLKNFRALFSMGRQALRIQLNAFDMPNRKNSDVYIHPDTTGINLVSFKKGDGSKGIDAGRAAAHAAMPEIKRKLAALGVSMTTATTDTVQ